LKAGDAVCYFSRSRAVWASLPVSAHYLRPSDRPRSRQLWHVL